LANRLQAPRAAFRFAISACRQFRPASSHLRSSISSPNSARSSISPLNSARSLRRLARWTPFMIPNQVLHIASRYVITALTNGSSKLVHHARLEGLSLCNLNHLLLCRNPEARALSSTRYVVSPQGRCHRYHDISTFTTASIGLQLPVEK
jgi:hypothetical protein